jgi:hypothetical protein
MQHIAVSLTQEQVRRREKHVTRRHNWHRLRPGTLLQPIEKGQGLKKGERVQPVGGPVRVVKVRRERLSALLEEPYGSREAALEGFPEMAGRAFLEFWCREMKAKPSNVVTRIEWVYTELPPFGRNPGEELTTARLF